MARYYPVVIFCYNRPKHLQRTLLSLKKNEETADTSLFVFSDGPASQKEKDAVNEVHTIIDNIDGFKDVTVKKQTLNIGLSKSVIEGVSEVLQRYDACIVLEDDLELSPFFLRYMNKALSHYKENDKVFSVSGYCPPISIPSDFPCEAFRFPRINSWGWATWRDRWEKVDWNVNNFDSFINDHDQVKKLEQQGKDLPVMLLKQQTGKNNSWAVRFNQACFEFGKTNIYPVHSLVQNRGADSSGTNMKLSRKFSVSLANQCPKPSPALTDPRINKSFRKFYRPSLYRKMINRIKIFRYRNKT